ncbi:DUF2304 domain-containing protein [Lewinella sp. IMCC34191]|uniref:DUF2304 domain-containing protein n=1 Tax=Lewinella sp. IMCC34191 TaxID=2259172 RepID=UPI000E22666A|nr:DUF2304 domain-containing protein [Lewinella sp. IMCC34191]
MEPIQLLLLAALLAIALVYLHQTRNRLGPILLPGLVLSLGVLAVYDPDGTTAIANYLGVGRGADLLLYSTVIGFCAALVIIYGKFRRLDERYTEVVRELALLREAVERGERG